MIAFELTPVQEEIRARVRTVARDVIAPLARELDAAPAPDPRRMPEVLAAHGLTCLLVPEEFGGPGYDNVTAALVLEEIAAACAGAASIVAATMHAMAPLLIAGTNAQRARYFPLLVRGGVAAFALSEPRVGSDAGALATSARPTEGGYILEGQKPAPGEGRCSSDATPTLCGHFRVHGLRYLRGTVPRGFQAQ